MGGRLTAALLAVAAIMPAPALAERVAVFDLELINTSLEPTHADELARLAMVGEVATAEFARHGLELVDTGPVAAEVAAVKSLRDCNGCELDLARKLGADLAAVGWVQKVSNLILNLTMQVREVGTGRLVRAGSVDIRGNTDESWRRGITYLVNRRLFPS
jgi:hypothetical protein